MADAEDLKSFGLWPCWFESGLRHHNRTQWDFVTTEYLLFFMLKT